MFIYYWRDYLMDPVPIGDGRPDSEPQRARCNVCQKLRPCFIGPVVAEIPAPRGEPFQVYARYCKPCLQSMVDTALHRP